MIDLSSIAENLVQGADGIWHPDRQRDVSYPAEGNEACFAVEDGSFWFNHRNRLITHLVRAYPPGGAMFDVGGGNGYVAMALLRARFETVVVEPGPEGARHAKRRGVPVVVQSTLEDAGFRDNVLPSIGLFDVLEHIEGDAAFLERLHTYLMPQGLLYLTVPAYQQLWSADDVQAGHYRRYTTRTLTDALQAAGFTVRYCSYFFWFLVPAVFLFRSLPTRLGIHRSISPDTSQRDHTSPGGLSGRLLDRLLAGEFGTIEGGKRVPFGSSCIAVAQKTRP